MLTQTLQRDLLLVGGGHAHVIALRQLAMRPVPGLRVTLISPDSQTPYSGMLPGLLAGHYTFDEAHIDLDRLCVWAGARFFRDQVTGFDPEERVLHCRDRGIQPYDIVSFDIGSQPEMDSVPGAREYAVPVKPVSSLWQRWAQWLAQAPTGGTKLLIVGGGAGSVEIALAIAHHFRDQALRISLLTGAHSVLPGYSASVQRRVGAELERQGIELQCGQRVTEVFEDRLATATGETFDYDSLLWCTGAAAAPWLKSSGAPVDERGFLTIRDTLQSTGYDNVFAAGDTAVQVNHPRLKAGVYAVRQGPVLASNLAAFAGGRSLLSHEPQKRFLSLLSLGEQRAIAERNGVSLEGRWAWRWKDRIDHRFMRQFSELPTMKATAPSAESDFTTQPPCGGCGAKVAADVLGSVLTRLRAQWPENLADPEVMADAALIQGTGAMVQSVDALRPMIDDPWLMGRIAAQHALSDIFAAGAQPIHALALITLPFSNAAVLERDLDSVLRGALSAFAECGCELLGGHSMQGPEMQIAFSVAGSLPQSSGQTFQSRNHDSPGGAGVDSSDSVRTGNEATQDASSPDLFIPGNKLVLTRPLGTGVLFAARMQRFARPADIDNALMHIQNSNLLASRVALKVGALIMTDITGFGLAGHLFRSLQAVSMSKTSLTKGRRLIANLQVDQVPVLDGALEAIAAGVRSTNHAANRASFSRHISGLDHAGGRAEILFDPQTGGGLLVSVPESALEAFNAGCAEDGIKTYCIGYISSKDHRDEGVELRLE
ncbi:MAG: selenide, water dikinase SelD [Pseudomonadota bacterium]